MVKPTPSNPTEPKYTGVRKRKWGKWVSEIRLPNSRQRIWLGSYDTPEKAARAFDAAQYCLRGSTAKFNFPDHPPDIPGGRSLPPPEIQAAAARFANSHPTTTTDDNSSSSCNSSEPETESVSDGAPTWTETSPFLHDFTYMDLNSTPNTGLPDFGIYPGFDYYFMPPPPVADYGEDNGDGIYLQGPSFLWNF